MFLRSWSQSLSSLYGTVLLAFSYPTALFIINAVASGFVNVINCFAGNHRFLYSTIWTRDCLMPFVSD